MATACTFERRPVKDGVVLVYSIGRSYLLELLHRELQSDLVRFAEGPATRRAYEQLANLELELRDTGMIYTLPVGATRRPWHLLRDAVLGGPASASAVLA